MISSIIAIVIGVVAITFSVQSIRDTASLKKYIVKQIALQISINGKTLSVEQSLNDQVAAIFAIVKENYNDASRLSSDEKS